MFALQSDSQIGKLLHIYAWLANWFTYW